MTEAKHPRTPGLEEEFLLARAQGIPAFVLGATGGQAGVIADRARRENPPYASLGNPLSVDENEYVATTDDYGRAVRIIWDAMAIGR